MRSVSGADAAPAVAWSTAETKPVLSTARNVCHTGKARPQIRIWKTFNQAWNAEVYCRLPLVLQIKQIICDTGQWDFRIFCLF